MEYARERASAESLGRWEQSWPSLPRFNYRWEHLLAVDRLSRDLGSQLGADMDILVAAVWLHDVVKTHSLDQGPIHGTLTPVLGQGSALICIHTNKNQWHLYIMLDIVAQIL